MAGLTVEITEDLFSMVVEFASQEEKEAWTKTMGKHVAQLQKKHEKLRALESIRLAEEKELNNNNNHNISSTVNNNNDNTTSAAINFPQVYSEKKFVLAERRKDLCASATQQQRSKSLPLEEKNEVAGGAGGAAAAAFFRTRSNRPKNNDENRTPINNNNMNGVDAVDRWNGRDDSDDGGREFEFCRNMKNGRTSEKMDAAAAAGACGVVGLNRKGSFAAFVPWTADMSALPSFGGGGASAASRRVSSFLCKETKGSNGVRRRDRRRDSMVF